MEALEMQKHLDNQKTINNINCEQQQQQQQPMREISFARPNHQDSLINKKTVISKPQLNTSQTIPGNHLTEFMNNSQSHFYFNTNDDPNNHQHQHLHNHQTTNHYHQLQLSHNQPQQEHSIQAVDQLTHHSQHAHHLNLNQCCSQPSEISKEVTISATDSDQVNYIDGSTYQIAEQQHQHSHWAALSKTSNSYLNIMPKHNIPTNHVPNTSTNCMANTVINNHYNQSEMVESAKISTNHSENAFYYPINSNNQLETEYSNYTSFYHKNLTHTLINEDHHHHHHHSHHRHICQQYGYNSQYDDQQQHQHQQENMQGKIQNYYGQTNLDQQLSHEDPNVYHEPYSYYESRAGPYSSNTESSMQHQHQQYSLNTNTPVLSHRNYYGSDSSPTFRETKHSLSTIPIIEQLDNNNNNCTNNWSQLEIPSSTQRIAESSKNPLKETLIPGDTLLEASKGNKGLDECSGWNTVTNKTRQQQVSSSRQITSLTSVKKNIAVKKLNILTNTGGKGFFVTQRLNQCRVCGRNYARPSTLKTHLRTHTNERPFKCNVCHKTFSQAANLTAHQRVHTGMLIVHSNDVDHFIK